MVYGKPTNFKGKYNIVHPEFETAESREKKVSTALQPVYPSTEKAKAKNLDTKAIGRIMHVLVSQLKGQGHVAELYGPEFREKNLLMSREEAFINVHFPQDSNTLQKALFRLKFDELFFIQLRLLKLKLLNQNKFKGAIFSEVGESVNRFYSECLPFELTSAQKRVVREIRHDLGSGKQMSRLVQGDVGSGKTIVALMSMLLAVDNGYQAALMAPTEILAEQHFATISALLSKLNLHIALLTGSTKTAERRILHQRLETGEIHILIGTHALIEDVVKFQKLGLVIVDEQHRFGVAQRLELRRKGGNPHQLMMSATPIPRTLAMSYYADLDVSVLDELPPGRQPIKTKLLSDGRREEVISRVRGAVEAGRQAYWVCPLIEESEKLQLQTALDTHAALSLELDDLRIGLVHGRLKADEKAGTMAAFAAGEIDVLVATTVIEVGVDVPNASLMVIEHAERFGLSQLHQLRGRVGRGVHDSVCVLLYQTPLSETARARLKIIFENTDGFEIARQDLHLRGPGEFVGSRQSGVPLLRYADLELDSALIELARGMAEHFLLEMPQRAEAHLTRWLGSREELLKA